MADRTTRPAGRRKELTRRSDELAEQRQQLPWVRVDKNYRFDTENGNVSLADLFRGRSQLMVYHFMFGPDYKAVAHRARPSPTASLVLRCISKITMWHSLQSRVRRSRS